MGNRRPDVKRGFTGIADVVEASYGGFLSSLSRTPNAERLIAGLREDWEAGKIGFKMYPNVTSIHAALDGLRSILVEEGIAASRIAEIRVGCGHMTFVHTAWEYRPAGVTAAQMNMSYGLSVMAHRGDVSAQDYSDDAIADPGILAFMSRIKIAVDPEIDGKGAAFRHAARIAVRTTDGQRFMRDVWHRRGSPENPVSRQEVEEKFAANVSQSLSISAAERLKSLAARLDELADAREVVDIMSCSFGRQCS